MKFKNILLIILSITVAGCVTQNPSLSFKSIESLVPIHEFATGISRVDGLTFDKDNNLYAASEGLWGSVLHIYSNGKSEVLKNGIIRADGIVFDNKNNLYISSENRFGKVFLITPKGEKSTLINKIRNPEGLAFDSEGYLYIVEGHHNGSIIKYKNGKRENWVEGLDRPENITFDNSGNLYVTETATNRIIKIDKSGNQSVFMDSNIVEQPDGITFCEDYDGLFITEDMSLGKVIFKNLDGSIVMIGRGFRKPQGVVCGKNGDLFISEQGRDRILRILKEDIAKLLS